MSAPNRYQIASRYAGEQDLARHDGPVLWPAGGGYPVRGETEAIVSRRHLGRLREYDVKVKVLRTWVPEELTEYREVLERVANRLWKLLEPPRLVEVPEEGGWRILLSWVQIYDRLPRDQSEADRLVVPRSRS